MFEHLQYNASVSRVITTGLQENTDSVIDGDSLVLVRSASAEILNITFNFHHSVWY